MANLNIWISAFRLRTLPLAFSSIFMAAFLAAVNEKFDASILSLCLLTTLFLQTLSNLSNDYGDSISGVDNSDRLGPVRAVQSGKINLIQMKRAMIICSLLAFLSGIILIIYVFNGAWLQMFIFFMLGLLAIAAAVKYTVGERPYGYRGLGDVFVFIFFGIIGVFGSYYLFDTTINYVFLLPAFSCGFLSVGVLNVNNIRDMDSDRKAGKKSVPVRLGRQYAIYYHALLLMLAFLSALIFVIIMKLSFYSYTFLLVTPLYYRHFIAINSMDSSYLDPELKRLALSTLLFVILFGLGINY
ncbi:MAG: 1,4-dihydroxy-2-naphthoate polyprenyltransferase [Flammeovirgaceae bacterium]|jgi:1,4-dihydroxy-2-naphthoate polyprenyltransferase|nr:1,4-dihydroxy-2-naphthoate polyprenyltransferase [Flammeovirgaceae bacterium]